VSAAAKPPTDAVQERSSASEEVRAAPSSAPCHYSRAMTTRMRTTTTATTMRARRCVAQPSRRASVPTRRRVANSPLLLRSYPCCVSMAQSPSEDSKDSEKKEEDEDEARTPRRPPSCRTATSPPRHRAAPADFALT